jgi:hypothetical protein
VPTPLGLVSLGVYATVAVGILLAADRLLESEPLPDADATDDAVADRNDDEWTAAATEHLRSTALSTTELAVE